MFVFFLLWSAFAFVVLLLIYLSFDIYKAMFGELSEKAKMLSILLDQENNWKLSSRFYEKGIDYSLDRDKVFYKFDNNSFFINNNLCELNDYDCNFLNNKVKKVINHVKQKEEIEETKLLNSLVIKSRG